MKKILTIAIGLYWITAFCIVQAETFTVNPGDDIQARLDLAVSNGEDDVINLAAGTYTVGTALTYVPQIVAFPLVEENFSLTIIGAGSNASILSGDSTAQVLYIETTIIGSDTNSHILVEGVTFKNGSTGNWGGALWISSNDAHITVSNCSFESNTSTASGGGAFLSTIGDGSVTLTNNTFYDNLAGARGGGINIFGFSDAFVATITNNTFSANKTDGDFMDYGGGVYLELSDPNAAAHIYNNISWENSTGLQANHGDDLYIENTAGATVNLYNNDLGDQSDLIVGESEDLVVTNSNVGVYTQAGNMTQDPLFVDQKNGDLHLQSSSPCIDVGDNNAPSLPSEDIDGDARIINATVDMGSDEVHPVQNTRDDSSSGCFITSSQL